MSRWEVGRSHSIDEAGNAPQADPTEKRGALSMEPLDRNRPDAPTSESLSTYRQRIAELVQRHPGEALYSLAHHIYVTWLWTAYERIRNAHGVRS